MTLQSRRRLLRALSLVPLSLAGWQCAALAAAPPRTVLLKLDDVYELRRKGLSDPWKRVRDYVSHENLSASLGILGESLETPTDRYVDEMRVIAHDSRFEIWNHGFVNRFVPNVDAGEKTANVGTSVEAQFDAIDRTQRLISSRLGVTSQIFGPHASGTDDNTYVALARIPDIRAIWFYGPRRPDLSRLAVIQREANLEHPIFVPSLAGLQSDIASRPITKPYVALQGHPDMWSDERFQAFTEVMRWLKSEDCQFLCASDFLHFSR